MEEIFILSIINKRCFVPYGFELTGQAFMIDW